MHNYWWPANAEDARDAGLIPGLGRSPGVGNGNLLQYSSLENSMDRGTWWAIVQGIEKSQTRRVTKHTHTHTDPIIALHFHLQFTILRSSDQVVSSAYILKAQTFSGDSVVPIWLYMSSWTFLVLAGGIEQHFFPGTLIGITQNSPFEHLFCCKEIQQPSL